MSTTTQLVSGLAGAIGSHYRSTQNQLVFVEFGGKLSRLNLYRPATTVSSGTTILKGTFTFDLENGAQGGLGANFDLFWEQQTTIKRQMAPMNSARLTNLGVVDFNSVSPDNLQHLTYTPAPIPGSDDATNKLVVGDVFAVRTSAGNFAKVKILAYGYDLKIQWVTYHVDSGYAVLGTGYNQPEDVKVSVDDVHAYVTERSGDLVRVALSSANRAGAAVIATGMAAPQQMFLDEAHNAAYVVEFASPGHLWRINLTNGAKTALVSNLVFPVGLVLSSDLQFAYVTEQTPGPDKGRVSRIQLSNGARTTLATGLVNPFFLTWLDAAQTLVLTTERDPANRVTSINVTAGGSQVVIPGVAARPSSVALPAPGEMLVCADAEIDEIEYGPGVLAPGGPLLMGIGFVPFDKVRPSGLADTSPDPAYFYQVKNQPFGGTLPLMVNHQRAANDGAAFYRVKVDGVVKIVTWTDYKWNGAQYVAVATTPTTIAGNPGFYPVHPVSELFLWMNPSLGGLLDSVPLGDGLHTIVLDFVKSSGVLVESSTPLTLLVNNQQCVAALATPLLNGAGADPTCGLLHYVTKNNDPVVMAFTASHPSNFATFSFSLVKGVNGVALPTPPPTSGPVNTAVSPITATVASLMGTCNVAGFAEYLYVAATTQNGWGRQGQYDASAAIAFVLAPPSVP